MNTRFANAPAPAQPGSASTYDGFYLRNNLASRGQVPAISPYDLCPDIIQSPTPIADPQSALSTQASWNRIYDTTPTPGTNYYYVRGLNGASTGTFKGELSLFYTPAQLLLFPGLWKNNPLLTAGGAETIRVSAAAGHIGVGDGAFLLDWPSPLATRSNSTFCSFVAQNTAAPIPTISDWMELSQLLTQQLNFGWRNSVVFDPIADGGMLHRIGLGVPATVGESATLQLLISASGFDGDTLGFTADCFTPEQTQIVMLPNKMTGSYVAAIQVRVDPGFTTSLCVQYWNTSGKVPAAGSTINLTANYVVPQQSLEKALSRGILDSGYSGAIARQLRATSPQPVAPVGAVSFVAGQSGP